MPGTDIDISVVVPVYNDPTRLPNLLASFDKLTYPRPFEVILVDDCSTDNTAEVCRAWEAAPHAFPARFVRLEQNSGVSQARNEGIRRARGRLVGCTDSDCRVCPEWLDHLAAAIDVEKKIVGAGGRVRAVDDRSMVAKYYLLHKIMEPPKSAGYLITCNCCYAREPLLEAGGFPQDIGKVGGEDIAMSLKLRQRGWKFAIAEGAVIHHDFSPSIRGFSRKWCVYGYACRRMIHRYMMMNAPPRNEMSGQRFRPPVTGFLSGLRDLSIEFGRCRFMKLGPWQTAQMMMMNMIQRLSYLRGWRRAEADFPEILQGPLTAQGS